MPAIAASVALVPFENLSGDPGQDVFARGFAEDIGAALSRFGTLEVIYPRAVPASPGSNVDASAMATTVLHGSVRRSGDLVRVAVKLLDAQGGRQIWANRYDVTAGNLFAVEDEIAERIASALALGVDRTRLEAAQRRPLSSLETYDCWLRGFECLQRGTVAADVEARQFFAYALDLDPAFARAYAGLSLSYFNNWSCQAWHQWDETERLAFDYASRAARLDDSDAMVQVVLGRVRLYRREFREAHYHITRALTLNPNDTDVLVHAAWCRAYLGDPGPAIDLTRKAMRLNPAYPPWYTAPIGLSLFMLGRDEEVIELCAQVPLTMFVDAPAFLAASLALAGQVDSSRGYVTQFLAAFEERVTFGRPPEPGEPLRWLLHVNPFRRDEDIARIARGLRLAGLELDPDEGRPEAVAQPAAAAAPAKFCHEDAAWTFAFDGLSVQLTHQKGFVDLARLLQHPGTELHCLELADRAAEPAGDAPVLDDRARRELQSRIRDLQREIDAADADHDPARAHGAREELDQIIEHLSGALGLGGRSRALGSAAERARSAVTWRIRNAIRKIGQAHPRLGKHLDRAVRTGTFCVYEPETPVSWSF